MIKTIGDGLPRKGRPFSGDKVGKLTYKRFTEVVRNKPCCTVVCECGKEYDTRIDSFKVNISGCGSCPNQHTIKGSVTYLDISTNKFPNTFAIVDTEMLPSLAKYRWSACYVGNYSKSIYVQASSGDKVISLHRLLMGFPEGGAVDHISGNTLDNRLQNLRVVDPATNSKNKRLHENNTSGQNGVSQKANGKWRSYITVDKRQLNLGTYEDFNDAVTARKEAEKLYGYHENHGRSQTQTD